MWRVVDAGAASCVAVALTLTGPIGLASAATTTVVGPEEDVEAIVAQAVEKFQAKEYEAAVELFQQAYALSPEPNYLFNIGRVYEQAGDLEQAVEFYGRFVKLPEVEIGAREVALERLRVLRGVLEETAEKEDPPPELPADDPTGDEPPEDTEPETPTEPGPKKPDPMRIAGFVVLGVGAGAVAAGGAFGGLALQRESDLNTLNTFEGRSDAVDKGTRNALAADILFGVGGAMVVTGVVLVVLSYSKKRKGQRASVAPMMSRRGAGIAAEVRF